MRNEIIARLPAGDQSALAPLLRPVSFAAGTTVISRGSLDDCMFIERGIFSLLYQPEELPPVEVGMIGSDGMLGISALLGVASITHSVVAITSADGFAIRPMQLRRIALDRPRVHEALLRYANGRLVRAMQLSACHLRHSLEQRLAGWILSATDLLAASEIAITHRRLAQLLGVTRPSVTVALQVLEGERAVWSLRNAIRVRDRAILEMRSCGCHKRGAEPVLSFAETLTDASSSRPLLEGSKAPNV